MFVDIAKAEGDPSAVSYRKALGDLVFPEADELCIGYTKTGTRGSGTGSVSAKLIGEAIWAAIEAGMEKITHFEEVGLLQEGIGADRISDITANWLRSKLARYTRAVCERHAVPLSAFPHPRAHYDVAEARWVPGKMHLPVNPVSGRPVLLVPRHYLRALPTINADDFWRYCCNVANDVLRTQFNYDVSRRVSKEAIVRVARQLPELREAYLEDVEARAPEPYDFDADREGLVQWYPAARKYCGQHPLSLSPPATPKSFVTLIEDLIGAYSHFVEENGGWELLWNDNRTPRSERAAQRLFLGVVLHYCRANNIDVSPETNIGRGAVDFRFSQGHSFRALCECKLARNTRFWDGLTKQLPAYLHAEGIRGGWFLAVAFDYTDLKRVERIESVVGSVNRQTPYELAAVVVDARRGRPTASRL